MASTTEICNFALSHLGVGKSISNLETERSEEANVCRLFFETARDATLRDFAWPFATKIDTLALIEEDPNYDYGFSYQVPSDSLKIHRILSGNRNDTRQSRIHYRIAFGSSGSIVLTDAEDAVIEYTSRVTDVSRFTPDFTLALSFRLAAYIASRVTGGDPFKNGDKALRAYEMELNKAKLSAINEEQDEEVPESEFIRDRG